MRVHLQTPGDDMESDGNDRDGGDNNGPEIITSRARCHQAQAGRLQPHSDQSGEALCPCQDINDASNTPSRLQTLQGPHCSLIFSPITVRRENQLIFLCCKNSASFHLSSLSMLYAHPTQ